MAMVTRTYVNPKNGVLIVVKEENYGGTWPFWLANRASPEEVYADCKSNYCCNMLLPYSGECEVCGKIHRRK